MTWLDERIGRVLKTLEEIGVAGDMLGERGLWFKMSFFEWSARVPMIVYAPKLFQARRISQNTSLIDLFPTFLEWASDGQMSDLAAPIDGAGMNGLLAGNTGDWHDTAFSEYCGEGTLGPMFMVRRGRWKYIAGDGDPPIFYDMQADPDELTNLAGSANTAEIEAELAAEVLKQWDPARLKADVEESQQARLFLAKALNAGQRTPWDWQPRRDATRQYVRMVDDVQGIYSTEWSDQQHE